MPFLISNINIELRKKLDWEQFSIPPIELFNTEPHFSLSLIKKRNNNSKIRIYTAMSIKILR